MIFRYAFGNMSVKRMSSGFAREPISFATHFPVLLLVPGWGDPVLERHER